jgi:hypothetical protein
MIRKKAGNIMGVKLPPIVRTALIILVLLIVLKFAMPYLKGILKGILPSPEKQHLDDLEEAIDDDQLSYPMAQYGLWADALYQAMDGWGTDEDAIYNVFSKMKTNNDLAQLNVSFGVKESQNLGQWLQDDLSDSEKNKVRSILTSNGVTLSIF